MNCVQKLIVSFIAIGLTAGCKHQASQGSGSSPTDSDINSSSIESYPRLGTPFLDNYSNIKFVEQEMLSGSGQLMSTTYKTEIEVDLATGEAEFTFSNNQSGQFQVTETVTCQSNSNIDPHLEDVLQQEGQVRQNPAMCPTMEPLNFIVLNPSGQKPVEVACQTIFDSQVTEDLVSNLKKAYKNHCPLVQPFL